MNRPLAVARQTHILQTLETAGSVGVSELAERFGVSRETIRRDLKALAETGRVNIVHGGAAGGATAEPSLAARNARNSRGKAAIGRKAAGFVEDGMTIVINSGSTTSMLAAALAAAHGPDRAHRADQQPADRLGALPRARREGHDAGGRDRRQ